MNQKALLSLRSVLAGSGAVLALYVGWYVYLVYTLVYRHLPPDGKQRATGLEVVVLLAKGLLLAPAFWFAAVAVFVAAAYLARK